MEQGVLIWLKDHNNMIAGRKVELFSADTGGKPAGTKTKAQELIERDKVDIIVGPLAAFELLAISDYVREHKTPFLSLPAPRISPSASPTPTSCGRRRPRRSACSRWPLRGKGNGAEDRHHDR